jgi:hypothetical protein
MISKTNRPEGADSTSPSAASALLLRYRMLQLALVLAVAVSGVLLWNHEAQRAAHERRLEELGAFSKDARAQRDQAAKLLKTAKDILSATERAPATDDADEEATSQARPPEAAKPETPPGGTPASVPAKAQPTAVPSVP